MNCPKCKKVMFQAYCEGRLTKYYCECGHEEKVGGEKDDGGNVEE